MNLFGKNKKKADAMTAIREEQEAISLPEPPPLAPHFVDGKLQTSPIRVHLVGCGGTGSQMLTGLARLHLALLALGHPHGLYVTAYDDDRVSPANVGRQLFYPSDIGSGKARTLVNRVNCCYGLRWNAVGARYTGERTGYNADIVITCVDTAESRRTLAKNLAPGFLTKQNPYWLDCGNSRRTAQVFLTGGPPLKSKVVAQSLVQRGEEIPADMPLPEGFPGVDLPALWEMLPEVFDESVPEDDTPSCSLAESLRSQDLFINDHVSRWALHLFWMLLSEGRIDVHGYWINLADGRVSPVPVRELANANDSKQRCKGGTNG